MIIQNVKCYDFSNLDIKSINDYKYSPDGIVLRLRLKKLPPTDEKIFDIPGLCSISYKKLNINDLEPFDRGEGYTPFADENGVVSAVITEFHFTSEHENWNTLHLGVPTGLCDIVKDDLYIVVDKTHFRLVYGGKVTANSQNPNAAAFSAIMILPKTSDIQMTQAPPSFLLKRKSLIKRLTVTHPSGITHS